ncbi:hypothetical protein ACVQ9Z_10290 [Staphylococcus aureus]
MLISRGVFDLNDLGKSMLHRITTYTIKFYLCRKFLDLLDLTDNTFEKIVKSNYIEC